MSSGLRRLAPLKGAWTAGGMTMVLLAGGGTWAFLPSSSSTPTITASAPSSSGVASSSGGNGSGSAAKDKVTFTLSGAVVPAPGLTLGAPNTLPVTVTNPTANKNK